MIFDFNFPYKSPSIGTGSFSTKPKPLPVPFKVRAGVAWTHLVNAPGRLIKTVIELSNLIIFAVLAAACFGQSKFMNENVRLSAHKVAYNAATGALDIVGFFAPINATAWKMKLLGNHMKALQYAKTKNHQTFEIIARQNMA